MEIVRYTESYERLLFDLIQTDPEWETYFSQKPMYTEALNQSTVFIILDNEQCVGFIRGKDDSGFGFYVYDLLVRQDHRGHGFGKQLIDHVRLFYEPVYVMSDVDRYYEKIGMSKIGSIFE